MKAAALLLEERISLVKHFLYLIKTEIEIHQKTFLILCCSNQRFDDSIQEQAGPINKPATIN
jgi:hypothetical protein